jgi:predicted ATPase
MKGGRFELRIQPNSLSVLSSLADVGFGISQFLPIVVADLQMPEDSLLMISQPEIHLHPKVQATLGGYVSEQIKKTQKQYLIETHSEYLINRLRLNIVNRKISTTDVTYIISKMKERYSVFPITLKQDGEIVGAPKNFFDTYMIDVITLLSKLKK